MKEAVIKPLLKKPNLDSEVLKNYRPVSNLSYISKLTVNDLLRAVDTDGAAIVVLLDLSSAFDTTDHKILLMKVQAGSNRQGSRMDHIILVWKIPVSLHRGTHVGQAGASLWGPTYGHHNLSFHLYADGTQLHLTFKPNVQQSAINAFHHIQVCVEQIKEWMTSYFLKLNEDKTELLIIAPKTLQLQYKLPSFRIGDCEIPISKEACNLGVIFVSVLSLTSTVSAGVVISTCKTLDS